MTKRMTVCLAAAVLIASATTAAAATDKTCLTGNDPAARNDAAQITALEATIDAACPCVSFDGDRGEMHRDYLRCAAARVKAAVKAGGLRAQCEGRLNSSYRRSTCGVPTARDAVPCLERNSRGKLRCLIVPAADCQDRPGRYSRLACGDYSRCVDAGDTNEDYKVDAKDSGSCVPLPTETPTQTATSTRTTTFTATPTRTHTPTTTPSDTPTDAPTSTPPATPTATPSGTTTPTGTPTCGSIEPPRLGVIVNANMDTEEDVLLPPQAVGLCPPQNPSGGGCPLLSILDGSADVINDFDASASFDPRACGQDPGAVSFKWEILFPPTLQGALYASNGISGYLTPHLTIQPSSLPSLDGTDAGADTFWRVRLTVTSLTPPITQAVAYFRFKYQQTELSLDVSTSCQLLGHFDSVLCPESVASNALPTNEPH